MTFFRLSTNLRTVTKWTRACDKRCTRLISNKFIARVITEKLSIGIVPRLCLKILNLPRREMCIFGSRKCVPVSWMYKKQTSVSHGSTEPEVVSLDARLRMDCIPSISGIWFQKYCILLKPIQHEETRCETNPPAKKKKTRTPTQNEETQQPR